MLINKERIIDALTKEIRRKRKSEFPVNCKRWDGRLELAKGSTRRYIKDAADTIGFKADTRSTLVKLKRQKAH